MDCLFLIRNGVPYHIAFALPADERLAFVVALGTLAGRRYDWDALAWEAA